MTNLLSKEVPCSNISTASLNCQNDYNYNKVRIRIADPLQEESGLTFGQVLKKLIEEINRILNQEKLYKFNKKFIFIMRLSSLLLLVVWSVHVMGN
jgi:hypothetical protein